MSINYNKVKEIKTSTVSKIRNYKDDEGRLTDKQIESIRKASPASNTKEEEFDNEDLFNWDGN